MDEERILMLLRGYLGAKKNTRGKGIVYGTNDGIPQGSVFGPVLWSMFCDEVLGLKIPGGCELVTNTDDLVVVVTDQEIESLKSKVEVTIKTINQWMDERRLKLTLKTQSVVIFRHKQVQITPSRAFTYLSI